MAFNLNQSVRVDVGADVERETGTIVGTAMIIVLYNEEQQLQLHYIVRLDEGGYLHSDIDHQPGWRRGYVSMLVVHPDNLSPV
jgi:hypothetical protein